MENRFESINDPEEFRSKGRELIDLISDEMKKMHSGKEKTLSNPDLEIIKEKYLNILREGSAMDLSGVQEELFSSSIHLHDPKYMGHQVPPPYADNMLLDWATAFLNNGTAVSEMGQFGVSLEQAVIQFLTEKFGWKNGGGAMTSGGSLGNLTAMLAMRQRMSGGKTWNEGGSDFAILVSEESHYSVARAAKIMGWGERGLVSVSCSGHKIDPAGLQEAYTKAVNAGKKVIGVVANSCSTSLGTFDDVEELAGFAQEKKIWLHVDAAHGGPMIFSPKHRSRLKGIEMADSLVFDFHKLLHTPSLVTAVIFKEKEDSYLAFDQEAKYLWRDDLNEFDFEIGKRTLECTRDIMGVKAFSSLAIRGAGFLEEHIDHLMDITKEFEELVLGAPDFELAIEPETNIIVYRFIGQAQDREFWISNQSMLRNKVVEDGTFYLVKTQIKGDDWLRSTLMNPRTDRATIIKLLEKIRELAASLQPKTSNPHPD